MYIVFGVNDLPKKKQFLSPNFAAAKTTMGRNPGWPILIFLVYQRPAINLLLEAKGEIELTIEAFN